MEGGRSAWLKAVMKAKKPGMSLGDAMKAAKKTYKKGLRRGGALGLPAGGRRSRKVGGTAYGFTGGPYTGSDLTDGMTAFPKMPDATYQGPSTLKGGRRRSRRGGAFAPATGGNPAQLPGQSADAPATAVSPAGALPSGAAVPTPFNKGGRRTKKGRGYY